MPWCEQIGTERGGQIFPFPRPFFDNGEQWPRDNEVQTSNSNLFQDAPSTNVVILSPFPKKDKTPRHQFFVLTLETKSTLVISAVTVGWPWPPAGKALLPIANTPSEPIIP